MKPCNEENKELIEKYPFLQPRNVFTDKVSGDYDYSYILIKDDIYNGWWDRFGIALCEDIKGILEKADYLDKFRILQCKEKYGTLRIYTGGLPEKIYNEFLEHMSAWDYISSHTCIVCGKFPVPMRHISWICPYCDEHFLEETQEGDNKKSIPKEYISYTTYKGNEKIVKYIDMKPFYKMINYEGELKLGKIN